MAKINGTIANPAIRSTIPSTERGIVATSAANFTVSASGGYCTLSFATLDAGQSYRIGKMLVGYDALPSADGMIIIKTYAGVTLPGTCPITSPGLAPLDFSDFFLTVDTGFTVSLKGGTSAIGYISAFPGPV